MVDFQKALPAVSQCGIFSDLKKENLQMQEELKISMNGSYSSMEIVKMVKLE